MQTEIIENKHATNKFGNRVREALSDAQSLIIAVPFLTYRGLNDSGILGLIKHGKTKVRVLTSTRAGITEPKALRKLRKTENVELRLSSDNGFHAKFYIITTKNRKLIFIGSSNLTAQGLFAKGELNTRFIFTKKDRVFKKCKNIFEQWWSATSDKDIDKCLDSYDAYYESKQRDLKNAISKKTEALLRKHKKFLAAQRIEQQRSKRTKIRVVGGKLFQECIEGHIETEIEQKLKETTKGKLWTRKKWDYYCSPYPAFFEEIKNGDRLLIYDKTTKSKLLRLCTFKDSMHDTKISFKKDGLYFYAYTETTRKSWKKLQLEDGKRKVYTKYLAKGGHILKTNNYRTKFFEQLFAMHK